MYDSTPSPGHAQPPTLPPPATRQEIPMKSRLSLAVLPLALVSVLAAGCDDTSGPGGDSAALQKRFDQLEKQNAELTKRLANAERELDSNRLSISRFGDRLEKGAKSATGSVAAVEATVAEDVAPAAAMGATPSGIGEFLNSDDGQKALDEAMTKLEQRRDTQRREAMVDMMADRFAEMANLTPEQSERMKALTNDMMSKMRGLWSDLRDGSGTPEQRAEARAGAMAKMGELREKLNEDARLILDADQYRMFEEQANRMGRGFGGDGGFPGAGGPGGRRGGFGGAGGGGGR
jgi:hypothetical protein